MGTVLQMTGLQDFHGKGIGAGVVLPSGEVLALRLGAPGPTSFLLEDFGMHELRVVTDGGVERCWFMVSHLGWHCRPSFLFLLVKLF